MIKTTVLLLNGDLLVVRGKPIISNKFSGRQFVLFSKHVQERGMDSVFYGVVEVRSGASLGHGATKADALQMAKATFDQYSPETLERVFLYQEEMLQKAVAEFDQRLKAMKDGCARPIPVRRVGKKRQAVFDKSQGKCHYCAIELKLETGWHIEHMLPRVRGGTALRWALWLLVGAPSSGASLALQHEEKVMTALLTMLGLTGPSLFLTLAKLMGVACVIFFLADQMDLGPRRRVSD